jgi:F0F1-type ATP synthase membrane subunit b/b'
MRKIIVLSVALAFVFSLVATIALARQDQTGNKNQNASKLENQLKKQNKEIKATAQLHKVNSGLVVKNLKEIAKKERKTAREQIPMEIEMQLEEQEQEQEQEQNQEQEQIAGQIEAAAEQEDAVEEEITESIAAVEKRGKLKTLLIGSDYKNMGQLRSELVRNRNQIRQLTMLATRVESEESRIMIENQLAILLQQREGIYNLIKENEAKFSLLGWVFRFLSGYPAEPIDEQEDGEGGIIKEIKETLLDGKSEEEDLFGEEEEGSAEEENEESAGSGSNEVE